MRFSESSAERAPARAESFRVDGLAVTRRVHVDLSPDTPLVVLIHGAMDRAASFGRVMRRLPEFEVIAYDRRGYAASRQVPGANLPPMRTETDQNISATSTPTISASTNKGWLTGTIADHGSDLLRIIEFALAHSPLGATGRTTVLIGHSLGGTVALWVAANPSNPASGIGVYESPAPWLDDSYLRVGGGAIEIAAEKGNAAGAEFFYRMMIGDQTFTRLREADLVERRADGDALIPELESLRDPLQAFSLARVTVPVLVGSGELSSESMRSNSRLISDAIETSRSVIIPGAAHGAHLSRPDAFADYIRECATLARIVPAGVDAGVDIGGSTNG